MRNLQLTESEETVLVAMACFFQDLGSPDEFDQDAYDSLFEKITDPSPFDYSWAHCTTSQFLKPFMRMWSRRRRTQATFTWCP